MVDKVLSNYQTRHLILFWMLSGAVCAFASNQDEQVFALGSDANPREMPMSKNRETSFQTHMDTFINSMNDTTCSPNTFKEFNKFQKLCSVWCDEPTYTNFETTRTAKFSLCEQVFAYYMEQAIEHLPTADKERMELFKNSIYKTQENQPMGMKNYAITQGSIIEGTLAFMEGQEPFVKAKSSLNQEEFKHKFKRIVGDFCSSLYGALEEAIEPYRMHLDTVLVAHVDSHILSWARVYKLCEIVSKNIKTDQIYETYRSIRKSKTCSLLGSVLSCTRSSTNYK